MKDILTNDILYGSPLQELKSNVDFTIAKMVNQDLLSKGVDDFEKMTENVDPNKLKDEQVFERD